MEMTQDIPKGHELKILYGASGAMRRTFEQVVQFVEEQFPDLRGHITGAVYQSLPVAEFAANILTVLQMISVFWMLFGGEKLLRLIGYRGALPRFYWTIQNNAIPLAIFLFLLAPHLVTKLQSNEAFEIYLGEEILYSKLNMGRMPSAEDIIKPLVAAGLEQKSDS